MSGPLSRTMMAMALLVGTVGATGCEDQHQGLIDTEERADMNPLDPGNPEPEPGGPTDMGADWQADGGDDDDPPEWHPGDGDGGAEIDGDGALPDAAAPAPPPDAGSDDLDDFMWPDGGFEEEPGPDAGFGQPDLERPPAQGEVDPSQLPVPRCGSFGPARALWAGPGEATTFLHAGPGVLFDEPALAGCRPSRLRNQTEERLFQEMFFEYRWERLTSWLWWLHTLDGRGYQLPGRVIYGGDGHVVWAAYACVGSVEPEIYAFHYRGDQLLGVDLDRPADCTPMAAGDSSSVRYTYGEHARWPESRVRIDADGTTHEVELDYVLDPDNGDRLVAIQEYDPRGPLLLERRFTYDAAGQLVEEMRSPVGARGTRTRYTYDDQGRLRSRTRGDDVLEVDYDAAGDIEAVRATNHDFAVSELRYPEHYELAPINMDAEPHPDVVWR